MLSISEICNVMSNKMKNRSSRTQFNNFLTYVILLMAVLSKTEGRRRQSILHPQMRYCNTVKSAININLPGCTQKTIYTIGCSGYCKSEVTMNINGRGIIPKYLCCQPVEQLKFIVYIPCKNRHGRLQPIEMLAAKRCSCNPCRGYTGISAK